MAEKPFKCKGCSSEFKTLGALYQHAQAKSHFAHAFKCNHCIQVFESATGRDSHENAIHPSYKCNECHQVFPSVTSLEQHQRAKHPPTFKCSHCSLAFQTATARSQHEAIVHPIKCDRCTQTFKSSMAMVAHKNLKHPPTFKCSHCSLAFQTATARSQHEAAVHSVKCDRCTQTFKSSMAMVAHKNSNHPSFPCMCCSRVFDTAEDRFQHGIIAHPTHRCDQCDGTYVSASALEQHKRKVHIIFGCPHCDRVFESVQACNLHVTVTHLACDICTKTFKSSMAMMQHKKDKHPSFPCMHCSTVFESSAARDQHVAAMHQTQINVTEASKQHVQGDPLNKESNSATANYSYSCGHCNHKFQSMVALQEHANHEHKLDVEHSIDVYGSPQGLEARLAFCSVLVGTDETSEDALVSSKCNTPEVAAESHSLDTVTPESDRGAHLAFKNSMGSLTHNFIDEYGEKDTQEAPHILIADSPPPDPPVVHHCPSCQDVFDTDVALQSHTCVSYQVPLHCVYCFCQFGDEDSLRQHLDERMMFTCEICDSKSCSEDLLQDHVDSHPTCLKCKHWFKDESEFCSHMEREHPVVVCWECGGAVICQDNLDLHFAAEHSSTNNVCAADSDALDKDTRKHDNNTCLEQTPDQTPKVECQDTFGSATTCPTPKSANDIVLNPERDHRLASTVSGSSDTPTSFSPRSGVVSDGDNRQFPPRNQSGSGNTGHSNLCPSPSPTPFVNGSDTTQSDIRASETQHVLVASIPRSVSPDPTVITESFDGTSDPSLPSSSSHSSVYVTADSIPEASSRASSTFQLPSALSSLELDPDAINHSVRSTAHKGATRSNTRLHCRLCNRDPCEGITATFCGHIFCKECITQAVIATSKCPVCKNATLLYCLFPLDLAV